MGVAVDEALLPIVATLQDTAGGVLGRRATMIANFVGLGVAGDSLPVDASVLISNVVSGFADPIKTQELLKYYSFNSGVASAKFFQFGRAAQGVAGSLLGFQVNACVPDEAAFARSIDVSIWASQTTLNIGDILTLLNRGNITEEVAGWYLEKLGVRDYATQQLILSQRHDIPPAADLIRFAVRDAFTPEIVAKYGYADEYPTALDPYMSWLGLGWPTGYESPGGTDEQGRPRAPHDATWGEISWFAHWDLPSPTQGYDMYHMLYPDSRFGPSPWVRGVDGEVKGDLVFTADDLSQLLKTADYPRYFRDRMIAISNPPLTRVDTRRMYQLGIIDEATVYHQYRASGYDDANAWALTQYTKVDVRPDVSKQVCALYKVGILTEPESVELLQKGKMSKLQAEAFIKKCDLEMLTDQIQRTVKSTRDAVIHGVITVDEGEAILFQLGLANPRVGQYRDQWAMEIKFNERIPTLRAITDWYINGIIDRDDYIGRLQRLNYSDTSITALVKKADSKIQAAKDKEQRDAIAQQAKAHQAAQRAAESAVRRMESARAKQERELARVAKAIEKAAKDKQRMLDESDEAQAKALKEEQDAMDELRRSYAAAGSDKNLIAFWRRGVIDIPGIRDRLSARGLTVADQDRWIATHLGEDDNAEG